MIKIAITTGAIHLSQQLAIARPALARRQAGDVARRQRGLRQLIATADRDSLAIQIRTQAPGRPRLLTKPGRVGNANHQFVFETQRDLGGEKRVVADKTLGAVDRVHQPQEIAAAAAPRLFTIKSVVRIAFADDAAYRLLRSGIRLGHRRPIRLGLYFVCAAVIAADHFRGGIGCRTRCLKIFAEHQAHPQQQKIHTISG